jgi:LuxR family transcriptional regulator, maltose regulon positive regulatory protein
LQPRLQSYVPHMAAVAAPQPVRSASPARLAPPPLRPGAVERLPLLARLDAAVVQPLTVVRAPTGYGKTMLLARWVQSSPLQCAWATLSTVERTPSRLWPFVAEALVPVVDLEVSLRLQRVAAVRSSAAQLRALLDAVASLDDEIVLVLDDVQRLGPGAERALVRLLERLPSSLHLVLSTRREPALGLAVRRARGELVELVEDDLRFETAEAEPLFGAGVSRRDLAALVERLEGWPAGLHLAALAAAASERPLDVLRAFPGGSRLVADYLRQELLDAQPDDAHRDFLLRTSLLHRLTPAAVESLLGSTAAGALLESVAAEGSFLVPDGDGAHRYRRPVREFLQGELLRTAAGSVPALRRRAAAACERSGLVDEAIEQARAAGDSRAAAAIAKRHALELARAGRIGMLEHLIRPPAVVEELRRLASASAPEELLAAAERVARVAGDVPAGQIRTLLREAAAAERAYALLLLDRCDEARDAAQVVELAPPSASRAQLAAVASLAATRVGMHVAAAPLARASLSACEAARVRDGRACALAHAAAGVAARSHRSLSQAAALGEPAVRGLALAVLASLNVDIDPASARKQLDVARRETAAAGGAPLLATLAGEAERLLEPHERPAAEELSPAELRVLRLLASRLTQREIARELYLSPNTIKTHARVIYRKLGVEGRETAVGAARELNLV